MEGSGSGLTAVPVDRSALGAPASPRFWEQECRRRNFWGSLWTFFPFFFCPFSRCLWPRVCPNLPPHPKSESFRILSWLVS